MALSCSFPILAIFGHGDGAPDLHNAAGDILYTSYLSMARAGILAMESYDPKSDKWGQIHMQARFAILRTFLDAGDGFCELAHEKEDLSDLVIRLDRGKILSHGRRAVEKFLQKLHVFKSTADVEEGRKLYEGMTKVEGAFWKEKVRGEVLRRKTPRKVFVQASTVEDGSGGVLLKEYEANLEGFVKSWAEREV